MTEPQVPNPMYVALQRLRGDVAAAGPELAGALRSAVTTMAAGTAWKGATAATDFSTELEGRHTSVPRLVDAILADIDAELGGMRPEVSASEAQGMRQIMRAEGPY